MRRERPFQSQRGFSLIELLVALLILAFVALGIASLFSHAQIMNASGFDYAVLAAESRRTIEVMQALPFNDAALTDTAGLTRQWTAARKGFDIRFTVQDFEVHTWADMTGTWQIPATPGEANLKQITVRVRSTTNLLRGRREFVATALKIQG